MISRLLDALGLAREVARLRLELRRVTRDRNALARRVVVLEAQRQQLAAQLVHARRELAHADRVHGRAAPAHRGLS